MPSQYRASIKPYHVPFLEQFGEDELGTTDLSEVVNTVITDYRRSWRSRELTVGTLPAVPPQPDSTASADEGLADSLLQELSGVLIVES